MPAYLKGKQSREEIIDRARELFNEYGIHLTLVRLSEMMETTLGRMTHHFKNKDLLFIALAKDYEAKLGELRQNRPPGPFSMVTFIRSSSLVMDLQYDYRCAMRYIIGSLQHQPQMRSHFLDAYGNTHKAIRTTIEALVNAGSLQPGILQDGIYEVFLFQLTNLFTHWVINLELYDIDRTYEEMKPIYLKGIMSIFLPFVTAKGKQELEESGVF
jgi:AcrR family transcriptional regulator